MSLESTLARGIVYLAVVLALATACSDTAATSAAGPRQEPSLAAPTEADPLAPLERECQEFIQALDDVMIPLDQRYQAALERSAENQESLRTADSEIEGRAAFERMKGNLYELGSLWDEMADAVAGIGSVPQQLAVPVDRFIRSARQASRASGLETDEQARQFADAHVGTQSALAEIFAACPRPTQ